MKKEEFDNKKKLVYDFVTDKEYKPMSVKEMAMVLQVPAAEKERSAPRGRGIVRGRQDPYQSAWKSAYWYRQSAYLPLYGNTERVWICPC